jgi:glycoprotein endo-alpha-1,2-mannosidase
VLAPETTLVSTPTSTRTADASAATLNHQVHIFYYAWYGNPTHNQGRYVHWNHEVLRNKPGKANPRLEPPEDIGADFYPAHGLYSSLDPRTLDRHMREIAATGVGTVAHSWYPAHKDGWFLHV